MRITIKEKELDELQLEIDKLSEFNDAMKKKNAQLNEKKEVNMNQALEDYRAYSNKLNAEEKCEKSEVMTELHRLWDFKQGQENVGFIFIFYFL